MYNHNNAAHNAFTTINATNTFNACKTNSPLKPVLINSDYPMLFKIFLLYILSSIGLILIDLTFNNSQTQTFCNLYASSQKYYANIILLIKFKIMIILFRQTYSLT